MAEKQKNNVNEDQILAFLREAVDKIKTEEDPLELNLYRRLFRKAVPLTLRAYFTAYLLKEINNGKIPSRLVGSARSERPGKQSRRDRGEERPARQEGRNRGDRQDDSRRGRQSEGRSAEGRASESRQGEGRQSEGKSEPRNVLPDDISTTLFVSIGRNRRVYPRDLIGLIMQNTEIEREHIGDIRVLDNYSFVQVITEDADKIIAALNEFEYRGRKLAVSYSRKRDESAGESASSAATMSDDIGSGDEESFDDSPEASESGSWQTESDSHDGEENDSEIQ